MRYEDLEGGDEMSHGSRLIGLPFLIGLDVVNKDDEVFVLALEVDFDLSGFSLGHVGLFVQRLSIKVSVLSICRVKYIDDTLGRYVILDWGC